MARTLTPFYYREEFVPALQEFVEEGPFTAEMSLFSARFMVGLHDVMTPFSE
jgi:hypothetical protein